MRTSGILLPITSLPSAYGIGCLSKEAYEFIDQLVIAGQKYWQILPIGPTGYGDSPYQSFSTYAGNPYFIDLEKLIKQGLLTKEECDNEDFGENSQYVDYGKIYVSKYKLLKMAYERSEIEKEPKFKAFCKKEAVWLDDYAMFMAIKESYGGKSFIEWDDDIRLRKSEAMQEYAIKLRLEIEYQKYMQYEFFTQWENFKSYANQNEVNIIGDIPIYVAFDSADTWAHPQLFQFDEHGMPTGVAGCPPDGFSATGQLWGNPLYDWKYHQETEYAWWVARVAHCYRLYDMLRVDHFRGFDEYYNIPFGDATAEFGKWEKGPGFHIFKVLQEKLGDKPVIAEDLGFLTQSVLDLVADTGYPGMKVLQFAFDSREDSDYLPHNYTQNCVVYTGTHDNNTTLGWYRTLDPVDKQVALDYLGVTELSEQDAVWAMNRLALASVADLCIIPMQDYLGLGEEARINEPSTLGQNWKWRLLPGEVELKLLEKINGLCTIYARK